MKTTVEIEDELLKSAKRAALEEGVSLRQLIEEGLSNRLALHSARVRTGTWGTEGNTSREDLYAEDGWQLMEDIERAFAAAKRRRNQS
jgi:hypothetical protein